MRNFVLGIAVAVSIAAPALAGDVAVKAPAPAPVFSWTGWYAGVNAGAGFGRAKTDFSVAPGNTVVMSSGPPVVGTATLTTFGFTDSNTAYPDGFMGGGQIGYNWQFSPVWVAGLEADFQGALEKDGNSLTGNFVGFSSNPAVAVVMGSRVVDYQTKIDWFGTVRGRIGYVWGNGEVLTYLTGGLAYGNVDLTGTRTVISGILASTIPFSVTQAIGRSQVNTGWVVGYGTEGRLAKSNWTWKVEGLYMDLGTLDDTKSVSIKSPIIAVMGGQIASHTHFADGILRGGLNYQFH